MCRALIFHLFYRPDEGYWAQGCVDVEICNPFFLAYTILKRYAKGKMIMIIFRALCVVYTLSKSKYDSLFHHWLV